MMRYIPIFLFVFAFVSCSRHSNMQELSHVNNLLMADSIDFAATQIGKINTAALSDDDRQYYNLLKVQILSRKYQPIPDGMIDSCVNYYEKTNDKEKLAEAYYYKGGELYDKGMVPEGIAYFKKSEHLAEEYSFQLKYKNFSSLAYSNFESGNYRLALEYAKKCTDAATKMKSKGRLLFSKYYEYICFEELGKEDSAEMCLREYAKYIKYGEKDFQRVNLSALSRSCLTKGDTLKANKYIQQALLLGEDPVVCGIAGMYYREIKAYDKAEYMYKQVIKLSYKLSDKISAYHGLAKIAEARGDKDESAAYFKKEVEAMDSLAEKNDEENIKDIQYYFDNENTNAEHKKTVHLVAYMCIALCCVLAILLMAFWCVNRKYKVKIRNADALLKKYANKIAESKKADNKHQDDINCLKKEFKNTMENYMKSLSRGRRLYEGLALGRFIEKRDTRAMESLLSYYRLIDNEFFESMDKTYDNLTTQHRLILMLQHMGKTEKDIADLLCVSEGSVRSYLSRIKRCMK